MNIPRFLKRILKKTNRKRKALFLLSDVLLICLSMYLAFCLRFSGSIPSPYVEHLEIFLLLGVVIKIPSLYVYRLYDMSWRFVSLYELFSLLKSLSIGSLALTGIPFLS